MEITKVYEENMGNYGTYAVLCTTHPVYRYAVVFGKGSEVMVPVECSVENRDFGIPDNWTIIQVHERVGSALGHVDNIFYQKHAWDCIMRRRGVEGKMRMWRSAEDADADANAEGSQGKDGGEIG